MDSVFGQVSEEIETDSKRRFTRIHPSLNLFSKPCPQLCSHERVQQPEDLEHRLVEENEEEIDAQVHRLFNTH